MTTPLSPNPTLPAAKPDWLTRNWKWLIPTGILALFLLLAIFVGGLFLILETSFRHSGCYIEGLARARSNPQVVAKIGQPIEPGWMASGSINVSGPSGNADISIPISGPNGKGTIYIVAKKIAGQWKFDLLQVEITGDPQRIDLLKPASSDPKPDNPSGRISVPSAIILGGTVRLPACNSSKIKPCVAS